MFFTYICPMSHIGHSLILKVTICDLNIHLESAALKNEAASV